MLPKCFLNNTGFPEVKFVKSKVKKVLKSIHSDVIMIVRSALFLALATLIFIGWEKHFGTMLCNYIEQQAKEISTHYQTLNIKFQRIYTQKPNTTAASTMSYYFYSPSISTIANPNRVGPYV